MDKHRTGVPALDDFIKQHEWANENMFKIDYNSDTDFVIRKKDPGAWEAFINYFTVAEHDHQIDNAELFPKANGEPDYDKHIVLNGWTYNIDPFANKITVGKHSYLNDKHELFEKKIIIKENKIKPDYKYIEYIELSLKHGFITEKEALELYEKELNNLNEGILGFGNDKKVDDNQIKLVLDKLTPYSKINPKQLQNEIQQYVKQNPQIAKANNEVEKQQPTKPIGEPSVSTSTAAATQTQSAANASQSQQIPTSANVDNRPSEVKQRVKAKAHQLLSQLNIQNPEIEVSLSRANVKAIDALISAVNKITNKEPVNKAPVEQPSSSNNDLHKKNVTRALNKNKAKRFGNSTVKTKLSLTEIQGMSILNRALSIVFLENQLIEIGGAQAATQTSGGGTPISNFVNQAQGATGLAPKLSPTSGLMDPDQLNKFVTSPSINPSMFMKGNPQGYSVSPDGMLMRGQYQVGQLNAQQLNGLRGNLEQQGVPAESTTINPNSFQTLGVEDSTGPNIGGDPGAGSQMIGGLDGVPGRQGGIPRVENQLTGSEEEPPYNGENTLSGEINTTNDGIGLGNTGSGTPALNDGRGGFGNVASNEAIPNVSTSNSISSAGSNIDHFSHGPNSGLQGFTGNYDSMGGSVGVGDVINAVGGDDLISNAIDMGSAAAKVVGGSLVALGVAASPFLVPIGVTLAMAGSVWKIYNAGKNFGWWGKKGNEPQQKATGQQQVQPLPADLSKKILGMYLYNIAQTGQNISGKAKSGFLGTQNDRAQSINRSLSAAPVSYRIGTDPKWRTIKSFADLQAAAESIDGVSQVAYQSQIA
jgi:hypothetical protein